MRAGAFLAAALGSTAPRAAPASYASDPAASRLEFAGVQEGAEFKAVFHKFTAAIDFSPDDLANAHFDVVIDMSSVDSLDTDRDGTIRGADLFDVAHFPTARYVTKSFAKSGTGYTAVGALSLRGVTKEVPIEFKFAPGAGGSAALSGSAQLKRLDFGVGQGEWKGTDEVENAVKVAFSLTLKPRP
jgi:polyisoprenoid-binding protein YceI